ncbi:MULTISPECIES: energy-coupled thiamine transporter ThiT [Bacillaceae]|uniref:energy-coupled thiamine transporter ThiT n=1 Tax=Bacillaceae TaxID=186817 RepID=UPI001E3E8832|nr:MULTISPECIES: energy-coupled thiamine transporter ThiT [Bacillaceae]MCE4047649.1 energy-coupled thiamine transporter ThiT [Bacillus sp. Au-Bac7]MCM3031095.1 energy-coupled thiamine transporter ThiT [Niallia sp. MER 6]MDL0437388.1 energy-coupled thiamine transporter ThiT [Niallia sp. SS-2023]UPO86010.1 energy-coupled thiamine transporter ThiT [Niallia sp. Man26]
MKKMGLVVLIEIAIFAAFALVLDLLPSIHLGASGSISIAMVPIFIIAFRWGFKASVAAGFLWGLLQIVTGDLQALAFWQVILEYFLAFACIGLAGLFMPAIQNKLKNGEKGAASLLMVAGILFGSFVRYFWHFLAGVTIWAQYAPKGQSAFAYSLFYNGVPFIGASILCAIVVVILLGAAPRLVLNRPAGRTGYHAGNTEAK